MRNADGSEGVRSPQKLSPSCPRCARTFYGERTAPKDAWPAVGSCGGCYLRSVFGSRIERNGCGNDPELSAPSSRSTKAPVRARYSRHDRVRTKTGSDALWANRRILSLPSESDRGSSWRALWPRPAQEKSLCRKCMDSQTNFFLQDQKLFS